MSIQIVPVWDGSDGTGKRPAADSRRVQNDDYFKERIAERWVTEQGIKQPGVKYVLDRLPTGYSGWEKSRDNASSKAIDRYLVGHPSGREFRSMNEIWPHFQHHIQSGGSAGCPCNHCTGVGRSKSGGGGNRGGSVASSTPGARSRSFAEGARPKQKIKKQKRYDSDSEEEVRPKQVDKEGVPDLYRATIDRVKAAAPGPIGPEEVSDLHSPDWRAGFQPLQDLLGQWQELPDFCPRVGELVLFTRTVSSNVAIAWDTSSQALRHVDKLSSSWLDRPVWEVGVVTQLPVEPITQDDLAGSGHKKQAVTNSGFRVEPLSEPGVPSTQPGSHHKYVPLHAIRPFTYWRDCVSKDEEEWHPTITYALTVASSICLIGKYSFVGAWPELTFFSRALYVGPELIMVGDTVRLTPRESHKGTVTDVMVISSIRLKIVNLDQATDDDYDNKEYYNTCIHIAGKAYTQDPKRSFGGIAKTPLTAEDLPKCLEGFESHGKWYHILDPKVSNAKLEVPYTRLLGKCIAKAALQKWFSTPQGTTASASFQAVNAAGAGAKKPADISRGLSAIQEARKYSTEHDVRIKKDAGQSWFWAETRIEQLDLQEVNGKYVGDKDENRTKKQVNAWRQALKVVDGKKGSLDHYHAAKAQREAEQKKEAPTVAAGYGMMASNAMDSATDGEMLDEGVSHGDADNDNDNEMEADKNSGQEGDSGFTVGGGDNDDAMDVDEWAQTALTQCRKTEVIDLAGDDEDDEVMVIDG